MPEPVPMVRVRVVDVPVTAMLPVFETAVKVTPVAPVVPLTILAVVLVVGTPVKLAVSVDAVAPLGVILTVPSLFWIESAAVPFDVGIAETVTVPVYGEAPVGAILTVPLPF
jgi:hypothetical protein